jgi:hypothetical protein
MDFTTSFTVEQTPDAVFQSIINVGAWWTGQIEGSAAAIGDEFTYRYSNIHDSTQRVTEFVPGEKIVWSVTEAKLTFVEDPREWVGTDIVFDLSPVAEGTEIRFAHRGLTPGLECYDQCSNAWGFLVRTSLRRFITTGEGPTSPPWAEA